MAVFVLPWLSMPTFILGRMTQGIVLIAAFIVFANIVVDILPAVVGPRARLR